MYILLTLGMLAVSILFGWWLAGRAIRPLDSVAQAAQNITGSNLSNYLTLVYTSSNANSAATTATIIPFFGPTPSIDMGLADDPEPVPTILVGTGMALIGGGSSRRADPVGPPGGRKSRT